VLQTGLELIAAGFQVFVAADAVASRRPESREVALQRMARAGATPITVEMALFEWLRSAGAPEFRSISKLIR
jgi:nicotinamidase-related amidase